MCDLSLVSGCCQYFFYAFSFQIITWCHDWYEVNPWWGNSTRIRYGPSHLGAHNVVEMKGGRHRKNDGYTVWSSRYEPRAVGSSEKKHGSVSWKRIWGLWRNGGLILNERQIKSIQTEKQSIHPSMHPTTHASDYPSIHPLIQLNFEELCAGSVLGTADTVVNKIQSHHNLKVLCMKYGRGWWSRIAKFWKLTEYSSYLPILLRKNKKFQSFCRDSVIWF